MPQQMTTSGKRENLRRRRRLVQCDFKDHPLLGLKLGSPVDCEYGAEFFYRVAADVILPDGTMYNYRARCRQHCYNYHIVYKITKSEYIISQVMEG